MTRIKETNKSLTEQSDQTKFFNGTILNDSDFHS